MKTFISMLRGINVGKKQIQMAGLKTLYEGLKLKDIIIYIQSGNIIFKANASPQNLAKKIEQKILDQYGFDVPVVIRTITEMENIIASNPLIKKKGIDMERLHVTFLESEPGQEALEKIEKIDYPPDQFIIINKEVYLYCPNGYGITKLSNSFFESKLKVKATTRNWKTVNKLAELAHEK